MLLPHKEDAIHKAWLLRLLTAICENPWLAQQLAFKGGTCAAMRGFLDRFSVDLDFDFRGTQEELPRARRLLENIFKALGLTIDQQSKQTLQFFLKYPVKKLNVRHTIKIDTLFPPPQTNRYEWVRLPEIDRLVLCQNQQTMVSNKLAALWERNERTGKIAARDLFDIHQFFIQGLDYDPELIFELRKVSLPQFFNQLIDLIEKEVTQRVIDQDLNVLLPLNTFHLLRKTLKTETLQLLRDELERVSA